VLGRSKGNCFRRETLCCGQTACTRSQTSVESEKQRWQLEFSRSSGVLLGIPELCVAGPVREVFETDRITPEVASSICKRVE